MDFNEYQSNAVRTAMYPENLEGNFYYTTIGLAGEVGELLNKVKKIARDKKMPEREDIISELGDILWYLSQTAKEFGTDLDEVAQYNVKKLRDRMNRGVIKGSGDVR
ncbi:MAG: nucleoside triphosphate pyrophosphohydrolase family protein [Candidatus Micrarchaeota archaeon]|nr:nucleoside triphosphate pyrophosphohydrolase family protein [Candidatus Micrarchaeota archaeon]